MSRQVLGVVVWLALGLGVGCTNPAQPVGVTKNPPRSPDAAANQNANKVEQKKEKKITTTAATTTKRIKRGKEYRSIEQAKLALKAKKGMVWFGDFDDLETANQSTPAQQEQWTCGYNSIYYSGSHLHMSAFNKGFSVGYNADKHAPSAIRKGVVNDFYKKRVLASRAGDVIGALGKDIPEAKLKKIDRTKTVLQMLQDKGIDTSATGIDLCELAKIEDLDRFFKKSNCRTTNVGPTPQLAVKAINEEGAIGARFRAKAYAFNDFSSVLSYIWTQGQTKEKGVVVLGFNPNSRLDGWHYMVVIGVEIDAGQVVNVVMRNTNSDIRYWPVERLQEWMDSQRSKGLSPADRYVANEVLEARFSGLLVLLDN